MFVILGLAEERGCQPAEVRVRTRRSRQRVEAAVFGARHQQHIEEPHDARVREPGQLGQDLTGQRRFLEPDHEDLHWPGHGATRARSLGAPPT